MDIFSLNKMVAFVTGAGSGIGQRLAIGLAEAGADVAIFDLPNSAGMSRTIDSITSHGCRAVALSGDVTRLDDLTTAIAHTEAVLGPLDIAVNCAGIANAAPAEAMPLDQWQRMLDINLTGVFLS